jgi:hypothetical protein
MTTNVFASQLSDHLQRERKHVGTRRWQRRRWCPLTSAIMSWHSRIADRTFGTSRPPSTPAKAPMAHPRSLIAPLSRLTTFSIAASRSEVQRFAPIPYQTIRCATTKAQPKKKKKARNTFLQYDLKRADQFSLVDAMQYVLLEFV